MLTIKTWVNKQVQKIVHNRLPKGRKVNCNYTDDGKKKGEIIGGYRFKQRSLVQMTYITNI